MLARRDQSGFTLIELVVAMLVASVVIAAIYKTFNVQRHSYYVQDQVAAMQQNLRAALVMMQSDIWMAGYDQDPNGGTTCTGIQNASEGRLQITMDLDGNGGCADTNENVIFGIADANDNNGGIHDGIADGGVADLGRNVNGGGFQDIAVGVQAVGFAYAFDANHDGQLDTTASNHVIWALDTNGDGNWENLDKSDDGQITTDDLDNASDTAITGAATGAPADLASIRAVRVWILIRADSEDRNFINTSTYMVGRNRVTVNDGFRRRLLDTIIECRNMRK